MRGSKSLGVALAIALPLAALGYLVWVFFSASKEIDRRTPPVTPADSTLPWFESDPVDPANLHGTWASRAEAGRGANRRESMLDFRPEGQLVWTSRVVVGDAPPIDGVERYEYSFEPGRFLVLRLTERTSGGKAAVLRDADRAPKSWKLDWKADDKSVFQLRTDPQDEGRPHLLFRKSP